MAHWDVASELRGEHGKWTKAVDSIEREMNRRGLDPRVKPDLGHQSQRAGQYLRRLPGGR